MARLLTIALSTVALFGLAAVTGMAWTGDPGSPASAAFRLDDGSAGCNFADSGEIACRAVGDAEAAVLAPDGAAWRDTRAVVGWDDETPVLLAAESWWHGEVRCRVAAGGIVCSAGGGTIAAGGE